MRARAQRTAAPNTARGPAASGRVPGAGLEDIDDRADAEEVATRALQRISEPVEVGAMRVVVTASLGIALYPGAGLTASELIAAADDAMYSDKRARQGGMSSRPHAS